ncbi:uncharacterized protein LY79DRAFT_571147, partial [Colletotrichum navitas]
MQFTHRPLLVPSLSYVTHASTLSTTSVTTCVQSLKLFPVSCLTSGLKYTRACSSLRHALQRRHTQPRRTIRWRGSASSWRICPTRRRRAAMRWKQAVEKVCS